MIFSVHFLNEQTKKITLKQTKFITNNLNRIFFCLIFRKMSDNKLRPCFYRIRIHRKLAYMLNALLKMKGKIFGQTI